MAHLGPIRIQKGFESLAEALAEQILTGKIKQGDLLPNERELGEVSGLSRGSVREALRVLEAQGLVSTKLGRNGGRVASPAADETFRRSIGFFIRGQRIRLEAVFETRLAIEPSSARFAALHRTQADLGEIDRCHKRLQLASATGDIAAYVRANLDWHLQVVRASQNELLIAFMSAVSQSVFVATDLDGFNSIEVRNAVIRAHGRVIDAIEARDGDAAARRMGRHVAAYISDVQQTQAKFHGHRPKEQ